MGGLTILAGGTGSAKLIRGLASVYPQEKLTIIANVGDNYRLYGLYLCPDIDTAMYTLAGILDRHKGWGVKGDSFNTLKMLGKYGGETWFRLGDRDLATHLYRTWLLSQGYSLSQATAKLAEALGVKARIIPATDDPLETYITTAEAGTIHLQEFWVKRGGKDKVLAVEYRGVEKARPAPGVIQAIEKAEAVILPPANPITSIGPTLAIPGIKEALKKAEKVLAVSPLRGGKPFSGPAAKLMQGLNLEASTLTIAKLYREFLNIIVVDEADRNLKPEIERLGIRCHVARTLMDSLKAESRLALTLLKLAELKLK